MLYVVLSHISAMVGLSLLSALTWPRLGKLTKNSSFYKWLVVIILFSSWMFVFTASVLSVVPPNIHICLAAINMCAGLYSLSKICIYLFLAERLHIIAVKGPRHRNPLYVLLVPFVAIALLFFFYPVALLRDGNCHIGVRKFTGILMVSYDSFFGLLQTGMFALTLSRIVRTGPNNDTHATMLRGALKIALLGSVVAFLLSFFNILGLVLLEHVRSDLCFALCNIDVVGNACVVTYLVRRASNAATENLASVVKSLAPPVPPPVEETFELELSAVAEMLKQMQAQQVHARNSFVGSSPIIATHNHSRRSKPDRTYDTLDNL